MCWCSIVGGVYIENMDVLCGEHVEKSIFFLGLRIVLKIMVLLCSSVFLYRSYMIIMHHSGWMYSVEH